MAEEGPSERLLAHGVAAFNISTLTATLVTIAYCQRGLAGALGSLGTFEGVSIFAWLWLTTWWCTRRALRGLPLLGPIRPLPVAAFLSRGFTWGGINGVLFLLGGATLLGLFAGEPLQVVAFLLAAVLSVLPVPVAFLIGAGIGLVCSSLDLALLTLSRSAHLGCGRSRCEGAAPA